MKTKPKHLTICLLGLALAGCASSGVINEAGRSSKYVDYKAVSSSSSVGIESNDIVGMSSKMVQSMRDSRALFERAVAPRVLLDDSEFINTGTSRINKRTITNRIRVELNRAARGELIFVSREHIDRVERERKLKRSQTVDQGTIRLTRATAGVDFILTGEIATHDEVDGRTGNKSRYHQITFEMIDAELGTVAWGDQYEFKKAGTDDAVYR